ncbi:acyl-CoA dehydrogenase family protein [Frankia sp. AgB32]|uniref:acyl-CoA dehydrogenase family protein n=1 Tax=Frankia sp. AgB32 TaxID=631119 RepID=UPI00200CC82B|nr:acyl-CoA dehydrogenase family protein [Frankia sp. AgB32]MCK9895086.1 acyl-CoA/acyl-ACP dehydrogenase [Frankia sp. AgB32]
MPTLTLTQAQTELRDSVRAYARGTLLPLGRECDARRQALPESAAWEINQRFGRAAIPKEYGGNGLDLVSVGIILEELAYADLGCTDIIGGNTLGLTPILQFGDYGLRERFGKIIRDDVDGRVFFAVAGTEPESGSDVLSAARTGTGLNTWAERDESGWVVRGVKRFISNGPIASYVVTLCASREGPVLLVVDTTSEGFRVGAEPAKLGHRTSRVGELHFDDVFVPADHLVGVAGQGAHIFTSTLALARPGVGISSAGVAKRAYDIAFEYCRNRVQNGRALVEHQAVQVRLARLATRVAAVRAFAYTAFLQAEDTDRLDDKLAIMVKTYCSEQATEVVSEAMQLMGGNGYMEEFPMEKLYRDVRLNQLYEGENNYLMILLGELIAS